MLQIEWPLSFASSKEELDYIKQHIDRRKILQDAISSGRLRPVRDLRIAASDECIVFVVYTIGASSSLDRSWIRGKLVPIDAFIRVQLLQFPLLPAAMTALAAATSTSSAAASAQSLLSPSHEAGAHSASTPSHAASSAGAVSASSTGGAAPIPLLTFSKSAVPVRELELQAKVCRLLFDIPQRSIAFGVLTTMDRHEKAIALHNISEMPLLYSIKKSGSIASGDLWFPDGSLGMYLLLFDAPP